MIRSTLITDMIAVNAACIMETNNVIVIINFEYEESDKLSIIFNLNSMVA